MTTFSCLGMTTFSCMNLSEPTSPLDSATARFNPPVETRTWFTERDLCVETLLTMLPEQCGLTSVQMEGICRHESVFAGKSRLRFAEPARIIPAHTEIKVLWFTREPEPIPITRAHLLHEDDSVLVFNKPAWLPTQGIPSSAIYSLEYHIRALTKIPTAMALHRLDRQTSGIVVFAKDSETTGRYMQLFAERLVRKIYWAITTATPSQATWRVTGYMSRDYHKLPRVIYRLDPQEVPRSRWSETHIRVIGEADGRTCLEAMPVTGRTHQIRVHLAASRCFVLGDTQYGYPRADKHCPASRIQLHAAALAWPEAKRHRIPAFQINAPAPNDFLFHPTENPLASLSTAG